MADILPGRIVFPHDPIPDPQGKNAKPGRPFIVVSDREEIAAGDDLRLVAVSEAYGKDGEVELQWGTNCLTRLTKPSAAICKWQATVPQDKVDVGKGFIRPEYLQQILLQIGADSS